ncbi:hypothetical protein [Anaerotignum lactatifermentans]|uniref:hypothetical protein n=1 Tax=Anaerotignum lactatifermentans TaxID=160404 RepID=UPI003AB267D5
MRLIFSEYGNMAGRTFLDAKLQNGEKKPVGMRRNWTFSAFSPNGEPIKSKKDRIFFVK